MKRLILSILILGTLFVSCQKDPIGETATASTAGEWHVCVDVYDADGNNYGDAFGAGKFIISTFNTAANLPTEMYLYDCLNFWEFQVAVKVDPAAATFATDGEADNLIYDCKVTVTDGKISYGSAKTPSGQPADGIEFTVTFSDDPYGFTYKFYGYRYTGLAGDE